ncbi:condensation domain-containing protein [Nocardia cyriacigeorgica]|uniref:condensation domain-containing protein n=1 Tax=Nocardia cyriacigeorgica TaxID=135487 RepID=UPI002454C08B|nr:condensation domain-containing protein [Nocardia cyriacigeorgica]
MEFIELADYPLPRGRVIEWQPTATAYWSSWPRDHRAASCNHEHHLREALEHSRIRDARQSWLGHAFRLDGPLDHTAWRATLDTWIDRHEGLRTHVTIEGGAPARYTAAPGEIRMRPMDAGTPASTMAAYRLIHGLIDAGTSPLRWPAYTCLTIAGRDGCTVILAADHSIMDGYSTIALGGELRALYIANRAGTATPSTSPASYVDFCAQERARSESATPDHPAVRTWSEFFTSGQVGAQENSFAGAITAPVRDLDPAATGTRTPFGETAQRTLALEVLDAEAADAAAASARDRGHSLFAVLLAAFAATGSQLGAGPEFRTVIPLHTRDAPHWADSLGWFVGLAPFRLDGTGTQTVGELATRAGTELRRVKVAATIPFGRVCALTGVRPRISSMISYMDIRSAPGAESWAETDTRWLRSRCVSNEEFFFWFMRTPTGVTLNMRYPATARATRDIHRHVLRLRELLAECARYGDAPIRPIEGAPLSWR